MQLELFEISGIPIGINFYGLMYALTFSFGYYFLSRQNLWNPRWLERSVIYLMLGVILGGRIGYILIYNLDYYLENPIKMLAIYEGGMSFHGWLMGVVIATLMIAHSLPRSDWIYYANSFRERFLILIDHLAIIAPLGITLGRFGNYMNHELLGISGYTWPFAIVLNEVSYFPSPLLEMMLEGIILGIVILCISIFKKQRKSGILALVFVIGYSIARFISEFFREPDTQIGYLIGGLSMGQILSVLMCTLGSLFLLSLMYVSNRKK
jgi:phosphatidylglycerol:prolipoprotein diacylglycerol transferase